MTIDQRIYQKIVCGTSLVVQWLRGCAHNAGGLGSILGQGTRSHMLQLRLSAARINIREDYFLRGMEWAGKESRGRRNPLAVQWLRLHTSNAGGGRFDPWLGS